MLLPSTKPGLALIISCSQVWRERVFMLVEKVGFNFFEAWALAAKVVAMVVAAMVAHCVHWMLPGLSI